MAVANWAAVFAMALTQIKTGQCLLPCLIIYLFPNLEPEGQV
jgi:hypothetical protein